MNDRGPMFLVDTREKDPWPLRGYRQRRTALKFGDYTIKGLEDILVIERKSAADLASSLVVGRIDTQQNKAMLAGVRIVVVVEDTFDSVVAAMRATCPSRSAVLSVAASLWGSGVQPLFLGSRWYAERFAIALLAESLKKERAE